jgi:hypothetical protein
MTETLTTFDGPGRPAVTERTYASSRVAREMAAAQERDRPVLQVRLRPAPALDGERQVCDLTNWSGTDQDERLRLLRRDLQATFGFRLV